MGRVVSPRRRCRNDDESRARVTNVDGKRSSATANSLALTVLCTATVSNRLFATRSRSSCQECSYDQPSNRRRNPAPQYIEAIENRLHRAEALLKSVMPDVNLDDPTIHASGPPPVHFPQPGYEKNAGTSKKPAASEEDSQAAADGDKESMLESMVQNTGSLDLDDQGYYDFSGHSSGLVFLKRLKEQYGDIMGDPEGYGSLFARTRHFSNVMESPRSIESPISDPNGLPNVHELPSKDCALHLTEVALKDGLALMRFIHLPTMYTMIHRIYDVPPEQWGNDENRYLPLLYAVLAVGSMFATRANSKLQHDGYDAAIDSGSVIRHFGCRSKLTLPVSNTLKHHGCCQTSLTVAIYRRYRLWCA